MRRRAALAAAIVATGVVLAAAPAAGAAAKRPITLSGAPVAQALVADLVYFYRHAVRAPGTFTLTGGGTSAGLADAARGVTDAALVTRGLTSADPAGMVLTRLAYSGVCLASNRANPVANLTRAQVQDIVAGRVTTWSQIQGSVRTDALAPVVQPLTTGAGLVFAVVFVDEGTPTGWKPTTVLTGTQERDYIAQTPAGFGYVDLALTDELHVIPYEGVTCSRATVANATYVARRPIGIATVGQPRGELRRFLRWATTSRTARRVITTRYVAG